MKLLISIYLNRITTSYTTDFNKTIEYFKKHNVDITFTFKNVNVTGYTSTWNVNRWFLMGTEKLITLDKTSDVDMFVFNQSEWATPVGSQFPLKTNTPTDCTYLVNGKSFISMGVYEQGDYIQFCHEIMHALARKFNVQDVMDTYILNNDPSNPLSNFSNQWKLLDNSIKTTQPPVQTMQTYKYFSAKEVSTWKLKPELFTIMDKMREIAQTPFIITSGLRTPQENKNAGGVANSAHLRGLAVDLLCTDNIKRTKMLTGIYSCGIPVFTEIAKAHLHIDLDSSIHSLGQTIISEND